MDISIKIDTLKVTFVENIFIPSVIKNTIVYVKLFSEGGIKPFNYPV